MKTRIERSYELTKDDLKSAIINWLKEKDMRYPSKEGEAELSFLSETVCLAWTEETFT